MRGDVDWRDDMSGEIQESAMTQPKNKKSAVREHTNGRPVKQTAHTEEDVRRRAYEIHLARGGAPGADLEDWLQAERELRSEQRDLAQG